MSFNFITGHIEMPSVKENVTCGDCQCYARDTCSHYRTKVNADDFWAICPGYVVRRSVAAPRPPKRKTGKPVAK